MLLVIRVEKNAIHNKIKYTRCYTNKSFIHFKLFCFEKKSNKFSWWVWKRSLLVTRFWPMSPFYTTWKYQKTLCYYAFQSDSTLYSCLNVKELLARNRYDIWSINTSTISQLDTWSIKYWYPWHLDNYRVQIHSETRTRHDNEIQLNVLHR